MATADDRRISWGTAILAAFGVTFALVIIFGIAPSQFITTVNKTYGRIPNSRQSRFQRDMVSQIYHGAVAGWLVVGAYQLQRLGARKRRVIAGAVLLIVPVILFGLVPNVLHGLINHYVSTRPLDDQGGVLYDADVWVYTGYWVAAIGLIGMLTPGWIFGLKKIEARFAPPADAEPRTSAFGRPVVTPS